jgi:hypothetical protein
MCSPRAIAHRSVSRSPQFAPSGPPPASRTIPNRLRPTARRTCREALAPKRTRSASGAKTTKRPVMRPELVGVVNSSPVVWKR